MLTENVQRSAEIADLIQHRGYDKQVTQLSVGIIDLQRPSEIFGTSLDLFMYPASVFKIFIGAEVLRQIEAGQYSLEEEIVIKPLQEIPRSLKLYPDPRAVLKTGDRVTIDHLLYLMLAVSDNSASNCLYELVGMESILKNIVEPNGWNGTGFTKNVIQCVQQHKPYRHTEMIMTCVGHVAEFFALVEEGNMVSQFVSQKLKAYMERYDRTVKHRYVIPYFLQYHKGGYLETNLYASFYRKSGFGFDTVKGFGALVKNILSKGWAFQRYMHDAGVVRGQKAHYAIAIFTLSKQLHPRKYFEMKKLAEDIFIYMESV